MGTMLLRRVFWENQLPGVLSHITVQTSAQALHAEPSWVGERNRNQEMHWWPAWVAGEAWFLSFTPTMRGWGGALKNLDSSLPQSE